LKFPRPVELTSDSAITYTRNRTSGYAWPRFHRASTRNLLANFCEMTPKTHQNKKNEITWISLTCRPVTIDYKKKTSYELFKAANKIGNASFFSIFIPRLFMLSRPGEAPFCWPLAWYKGEGRKGIHCQIKSYKRPFRSDSCLNSRRRICGLENYIKKTLIKMWILVAENIFTVEFEDESILYVLDTLNTYAYPLDKKVFFS